MIDERRLRNPPNPHHTQGHIRSSRLQQDRQRQLQSYDHFRNRNSYRLRCHRVERSSWH